MNQSNYPPGITEADIDSQFGDEPNSQFGDEPTEEEPLLLKGKKKIDWGFKQCKNGICGRLIYRYQVDMADTTTDYNQTNFCDEQCRNEWFDEHRPPEIKHLCKTCGVVVSPHLRENGWSTGVYPSRCPEHQNHSIISKRNLKYFKK